MKLITLSFLMLVATLTAFAQTGPDTLWTRTYGGSGMDVIYEIQQTTDGGYVMAGFSGSYGGSPYCAHVVKTDAQGNPTWARDYGNTFSDAECIAQTSDGGFVFGGYQTGLIKTDPQGNPQWIRDYANQGPYRYWYDGVQQTADGGFIIAAEFGPLDCSFRHGYVIKTDGDGCVLWTRIYGTDGQTELSTVRQTVDGGYVITGATTSTFFGAVGYDIYLIKTDTQGNTLWTHTYGGNNDDYDYSVEQTSDGGYVIAGLTNSFGAGGYDMYAVKTNAQGDTLWTRTYVGSNTDYGESIQQTSDGGYVFAGFTNSFGAGGSDAYLVRTDGQGNTLWTQTYGGSGDEEARSVLLAPDGGYILAGSTTSFGAGGYDMYVVKTGPDPCLNPTPAAPQVVITTAGNDARLNWNRITQSIGGCPITVTRYLVFYSPTSGGPFYYHGSTSDTTYTHVEAVRWTSGMFYQVLAHTGDAAALMDIPQGMEQTAVLERLGR